MKKQVFLRIIFIVIILLCLTTIVVHAAEDYNSLNQFDDYTSEGTSWGIVDNTINRTAGIILNILRIALFCLALAILVIIGIEYMIHSAEPHFKAELKKNLPTYLTGVVILFGASGILQVLTYFINDIF